MHNARIKVLCCIVLVRVIGLSATRVCFGFAVPSSKPMIEAIKDADVIVQATIVTETDDATYKAPTKSDRGFNLFVYRNTIAKPGRYVFSTHYVVKGRCPDRLTVDMPLVLSSYYGDGKFKIGQGQSVLLLLRITQVCCNLWIRLFL